MKGRSAFFALVLLLANAFSIFAYGEYGPYGDLSQCATGVYMIVARGSLEEQGTGIIGDVAQTVYDRIPGSVIAPVVYPATLSHYKYSESYGVGNLTQMLKSYHRRCPKSKIALLGYSQGAQVVGDTTCGNSEKHWQGFFTKPLPFKYLRNVVAIIKWGDPTFVPGRSIDRGTAHHHGLFTRLKARSCEPFKLITRSYCDANDVACASGNSVQVHTSYPYLYTDDAAQFIEERFNNPKKLLPRPSCDKSKNKGSGSNSENGNNSKDGHSSPKPQVTHAPSSTYTDGQPYTTYSAAWTTEYGDGYTTTLSWGYSTSYWAGSQTAPGYAAKTGSHQPHKAQKSKDHHQSHKESGTGSNGTPGTGSFSRAGNKPAHDPDQGSQKKGSANAGSSDGSGGDGHCQSGSSENGSGNGSGNSSGCRSNAMGRNWGTFSATVFLTTFMTITLVM